MSLGRARRLELAGELHDPAAGADEPADEQQPVEPAADEQQPPGHRLDGPRPLQHLLPDHSLQVTALRLSSQASLLPAARSFSCFFIRFFILGAFRRGEKTVTRKVARPRCIWLGY